MKRSIHFVLCLLIVIGTSDIFARGGGRSSFSSGSRSSSFSRSSSSSKSTSGIGRSSRSSTLKSSTASKKTEGVKTGVKSTSTVNKAAAAKSQKPKAVAQSKLTKKKQKAMAQQNNAASKKYGNKKNAESAFREKMSNQNKYNSSTPPTKRPDYVPQNVTINNTHVSTSYGMLPGGGYGYGYMDPTTHLFCALAAHHMMVNDAMLMNYGYGSYGVNGQPIMISTGASVVTILFWIIGSIVLLVIIIVIIKSIL